VETAGKAVIVKQRLSVVTLGVADPDRAAEFYTRLGWHRIEEGGSETAPRIFKVGNGLLLALYDWTLLAEDATLPPDTPAPFRGVTLAQCLESPTAVDAAMAVAARERARRSSSRPRRPFGADTVAVSPTRTAMSGRSPITRGGSMPMEMSSPISRS